MDELALQQPELIGRDEELSKLKISLVNAMEGKGNTVFIAGEAGIGKTRLVSELKKDAEEKGVNIIQGWCLAESFEPLMPVKAALREAGLTYLVSGDPPSLVVSAYLLNDAGMLMSKVERIESGLDPDIFVSMLQAVGNFVQDSLSLIEGGNQGALNSLGYGDFTILIQSMNRLSLATVIKGTNSEFLIEDMKNLLEEIGDKFENWDGKMSETEELQPKISWFVNSGKYDGKFLVDDPMIKQENLFDNILLGLQRASEDKPIILFLDDLQWADPSSLTLLHYLARNTRDKRVLLLGTYRPEDITQSDDGRPHPLVTTMQNMTREGLLQKIDLARLDQNYTGALINSTLEDPLMNKDVVDRIYKESNGTPLYTLEVVKLLIEYGHIARSGDGWVLVTDMKDLDIPSKVYDIIKRRIDRLNSEQKRILDCASIIGEEFDSTVVGKVMELNKLRLLEDLNKIENAHQLIHYLGEKYRFDHDKIRDVFYNDIGIELRREYHRMVADVILDMHSSTPDDIVGELAYHYNEARDPRAVGYLIEAADAARACYQNDEALDFYLSAFENTDGAGRWNILETMGDIQVMTGYYEQASLTFEKILNESRETEMKIRIYRKRGEALEKTGEFDASLGPLKAAMELIGDEINIERGRVKVAEGYANYRVGKLDEALSLFLEGLDIFEELGGNFMDLATGQRAVGNLKFSKGEIDGALEYYGKSLEASQHIDDLKGTATTLANMGVMKHIKGDLDGAYEYYNEALGIREKIGNKSGIADSLNNLGLYWSGRGELKKALDCHEKCLAIEEKTGNKSGIADSLNNIGTTHHAIGNLDLMLEYHERSLKIRKDIGDRTGIALSYDNIGSVYKEKDDSKKALEYYTMGLEICLEIGAKLPTFYAYRGQAEAYIDIDEPERARGAITEAMNIAIEMQALGEEGIANRVTGMVHTHQKEWSMAAEAFEKAATILEDTGAIDELAQVKFESGLMWKAKGETEKAKVGLEEALSEFEEMGMKLWVLKCKKALADLG